MISMEFSGLKVPLERTKRTVAELIPAFAQTAEAMCLLVEGHIQNDYLSGQVLHVRSGDLRRSIHHSVDVLTDGVRGRVYSAGVKYAAIQNYGGNTAAHDIFPKTADALCFMIGGRKVFAKVVHHPGSKIPARPYMEPGILDKRPDISDAFARTAAGLYGESA